MTLPPVLRSDEGGDPPGHERQQFVADEMTVGVVDGLDTVEVDEQHRRSGAGSGGTSFDRRPLEHLVEPVVQLGAVGEPRQRVVQRQSDEPVLRPVEQHLGHRLGRAVVMSWLVFVRTLTVEWLQRPACSRDELRNICTGALLGALGGPDVGLTP